MSFDVHGSVVPIFHDESAERRRALFRESPSETAQRVALGTAWALKPERIGSLPALARLWLADAVNPVRALPDPERTVDRSGICGMVHDLSPETLAEAYSRGLFTFAHYGPLKWVSPSERCVLFVDEYHLGKTTRRLVRLGRHTVTFDRDFEGVIKACAGRRAGKWHLTWITPRIMRAYAALHDAGHAHSFEVWDAAGDLVGGGYGVAVGGAFFTESLFSKERDASKIGFAVLNWHLSKWGYVLNDGKWMNPVLASMGYRMIDRAAFRTHLDAATAREGRRGHWDVEADMKTVAEWRSAEKASATGSASKPAPKPARAPIGAALAPAIGIAGGELLGVSQALAAGL